MTRALFRTSILALICFAFGVVTASAQEVFSGIVVDSATLSALPSVNVQVKSKFRGTTTDHHGNFSISGSRSDTLLFTLVGYETLELPLATYEAGMIRLSEKYTMLQAVIIDEYKRQDLYEGMFDEQNAWRNRKLPFYFSKVKKEKIKLEVLRIENERVQTYVDVVIIDPGFKRGMMQQYRLTDQAYYNILRLFNERHHEVMYYLTRAELISLLNTFFESHAELR